MLIWKNSVCKATIKRVTCFKTLLQNELKSDVARFSTHVVAKSGITLYLLQQLLLQEK